MRRGSRWAPALPLLVGLAGGSCAPGGPEGARGGDGDGGTPALLVFAASGLRDALEELVPLYEASEGVEVDLVLGSSGNLATQIRNGAPADVFVAADGAFLAPLDQAGLILEGSRRVVGVGRVALVWREGLPPPTGVEVLASAGSTTVSIANPELAPYGAAALDILEAAGLGEVVAPRLVMGENVSQALQFVESGNADFGLVALSLVRGTRPREHLLLSDTPHPPLAQEGAVLLGGARTREGEGFLGFLLSPQARAVLDRFGFEPPAP